MENKRTEELVSHLQNSEPAKISLACEDIDWLIKHDRDSRSATYWTGHALREGAKAQRRSMQFALDADRRKKAEETQESNNKAFTTFILQNPETALDLAKLLGVAASFKVATDIVMEIHNKAVAAKKINDSAQSKKAA